MLFGLFKKRRGKKSAAVNASSQTLLIQLTLCSATPQQILSDKFALGYMFGFHDSIAQACKIDNLEKAESFMIESYCKIFDDRSLAEQIMLRSLNLQSDDTFMKGMLSGGQEALDLLKNKKTPMGLNRHLRNSGSEIKP